MCGIFGFAGNIPKRQQLLTTLAALNEARGEDSTGYATVLPDRSYRICKRVMPAHDFLWQAEWSELTSLEPARVGLGHTRWASVGKVSQDNAHPHRVRNIILTHNGTINNLSHIAKREGKRFQSDSKALTYLISRYGNCRGARGMASLAFVDLKSAADLTLQRWKKPLAIAEFKHGILYSSEERHLWSALAVSDLSDGADIWEVIDGTTVDIFLDADGRMEDIDTRDALMIDDDLMSTRSKRGNTASASPEWDHLRAIWDKDEEDITDAEWEQYGKDIPF